MNSPGGEEEVRREAGRDVAEPADAVDDFECIGCRVASGNTVGSFVLTAVRLRRPCAFLVGRIQP
ncbi:hypothetical protein, partial [Rhodococcus rhodochrous]|uniref:hypothetical protein n=1 Tax=Rhodococcus rhodochrous TaxID=1829 RepID=UPI001EE6C5F3